MLDESSRDVLSVVRGICEETMRADRARAVQAARLARYRSDRHVVAEVLYTVRVEDSLRRGLPR